MDVSHQLVLATVIETALLKGLGSCSSGLFADYHKLFAGAGRMEMGRKMGILPQWHSFYLTVKELIV